MMCVLIVVLSHIEHYLVLWCVYILRVIWMERDGRLTQLHEDFKKLEKEEKEDVNQLQQFVIIPDKGEHQLLQINLIPAGIIFFKGQSIYSNSSQMNIKAQNLGGLLRNLVVKDK